MRILKRSGKLRMKSVAFLVLLTISLTQLSSFPTASAGSVQQPQSSQNLQPSIAKLEAELTAKYGEAQRARLQRGMKQVASFWRSEDGDAAAFEDLVRTQFAGDQTTL